MPLLFWYNHEHHLTGIALLTLKMLHYGTVGAAIEQRQKILDDAYARNPERLARPPSKHPPIPTAVWVIAQAVERRDSTLNHYRLKPVGCIATESRSCG